MNPSSKSPKHSHAVKQFFETPLYQLAEMKTIRAVDRIFAQNSIQKVHEIFNQIQEDKRYNTNKLRSTLQKNYEKMLDCSELLQRVSQYGKKIKEIADEISMHVVEDYQEDKKKKGDKVYKIKYNYKRNAQGQQQIKQGWLILKIQEKIRKNQLSDAMIIIMANKQRVEPGVSKSQLKYLEYLVIDILMKLQKNINNHRLTLRSLKESILTLQKFMIFQNKDNLEDLLNLLSEKYEDSPYTSIFQTIIRKLKNKQGAIINLSQKYQQIAYEVIFDYKLSVLISQCKEDSMHSFEQYFEDILLIFQEAGKKTESKQQKILSQLLQKRAPQVKADLAKIFIIKNEKGQITFRSQLYDHLMESKKFNTILSSIQKIVSSCAGGNLSFFKELWQSYFIILIDYCVEQIDPLPYVKQFTEWREQTAEKKDIPPEIQPYIIDKSAQKSSQTIMKYIEGINLASRNLQFALQRSSSTQQALMRTKTTQKMDEVWRGVSAYMKELLQNEVTQQKFRQFIILRVLSEYLAIKVQQINKQSVLYKNNQQIQPNYKQLHRFLEIFCKNSASRSLMHQCTVFENNMNQFDSYFIGYLENFAQQEFQTVRSILADVILKILLGYLQAMDRNSKCYEILEHTYLSLHQKKQKMSIMDHIILPYTAKTIFKCEFKCFTIDQDIYSQHFTQTFSLTKKQKIGAKQQQVEEDFQIGDKEEIEEVVKMGGKKSLFNMGNNLLYGFMPKKR